MVRVSDYSRSYMMRLPGSTMRMRMVSGYSRSFMMRAIRLLGSTMAFRETPFITLSLVRVRMF